MSAQELAKHQSAEDESMRKFRADQVQLNKLKQFRQKYVNYEIYLHACNVCKRYGMMLHLETCILCGAPNSFFLAGTVLPEDIQQLLVEDMMALESPDIKEIPTLPSNLIATPKPAHLKR